MSGQDDDVAPAQLVAEDLGYQLGSQQVLRGISFAVAAGELFAVAGPSGSGKTTLLSILGGLEPPSEGRVLLRGIDLFGLSASARALTRAGHVGFVFQSHNLLPALTALENVALAARPDRDSRGKARAALAALGLGALGHRLPRALSLGEQQRVAVARALVRTPSILLADEPTASLDGDNGARVLDALALAAEAGAAVLVASHDERCLVRAHRVIHLLDGKVQRLAS